MQAFYKTSKEDVLNYISVLKAHGFVEPYIKSVSNDDRIMYYSKKKLENSTYTEEMVRVEWLVRQEQLQIVVVVFSSV